MRSGRRRPTGRGPAAAAPWWAGPVPIAVVVLLVAAAIVVFILVGRAQSPGPSHSASTDARVVAAVTTLDVQATEAVGAAGVKNPLQPARGMAFLTGPGGKVEVLYIGAEFCPFCAAERWSLVVALSRFGTFSGLALTTSSSLDAYPDTPTFTFAHATYAGSVLALAAIEETDRARNVIQTPSPDQERIFEQLNPKRSIPFVDIGNRYFGVGSGFQVDVLSGLSWQQIATELQANPRGPVAGPILGNANWITAGICQALLNPPDGACAGSAIVSLRGQLGAAG